MRGKLSAVFKCYSRNRITPADAGKTFLRFCCNKLKEHHPRGCGENLTIAALALIGDGSPPQVRGKPIRRAAEMQETRITPAGAGKTSRAAATHRRAEDHPRRCGENFRAGGKAQCPAGSPPQVRGKRCGGDGVTAWSRITPAGAGKTKNTFRST